MRRAACRLVVVALLVASIASADTGRGESPVFLHLFGTWQGEGVVAGLPSRIAMSWAPTIGGRFVRVTWRNEMTVKDGSARSFDGEGTYLAKPDSAGVHVGTWFDSQGALHPLAGRVEGDSLVTLWGKEGGTLGRTTYRLVGEDGMVVRDEIRRGDAWIPFGRSAFRRAPAPPH